MITLLLTSFAAAAALLALTAVQLTERSTAQQFLARALSSLLEIDQYVTSAWPDFEQAAASGEPIALSGVPFSLQLNPEGLAAGPDAVSDEIAAATASLVYDGGLDTLSDAPQAFRLISRGAAYDETLGRLTSGGHDVATVALVVSGSVAVLLAMAAAAQVGGLTRIGAPALAIALGAGALWLAAILAQSAFEGRVETATDLFAADLWRLAADALAFAVRNAAIVALAAATVAALAAAAGLLLRTFEDAERFGSPGVR